jgi:hypothetical protein
LAIRALDIPGESRGHFTYITYSALMMVMRRRGNIKKKYQPDPHKKIINTCLLLFFQPVYGSSLSANGKKALSRGSTLRAVGFISQVR